MTREERIEQARQRYHRAIDATSAPATAKSWGKRRFEHGLELADEFEKAVGPLAGLRLLEVASGLCGDLAGLAARGAKCTGSDWEDLDYPILLRNLSEESIRLVRFDAMKRWPFADRSFDVVVSMELVELVQDFDQFFGEMSRVLKPGGAALINTSLVLKGLRDDPLYHLPGLILLPSPLRKFIGEKIFNRHPHFQLSSHSMYSAAVLRPAARRAGLSLTPMKLASSPIAARVSRWPFAGLWKKLLCRYFFDFILVRPVARADPERPEPATGSRPRRSVRPMAEAVGGR